MTDDQSAILELTVLLVISGRVHFRYYVEAENHYDGLLFYIDNVLVLPLVSITDTFRDFEANLTSGYHSLKWVYYKDFSISVGIDGVLIKVKQTKTIFFGKILKCWNR